MNKFFSIIYIFIYYLNKGDILSFNYLRDFSIMVNTYDF